MTPDQVANIKHQTEARLWAAVLLQALDDATQPRRNSPNAARIQRQAREWFQSAGKDFREVCALAGMDHEWIRENALKRIEEVESGATNNGIRYGRCLTHNGETLSVAEWSRRTGVGPSTINHRIKAGYSIAQALTPGKLTLEKRTYEHNGETHTLDEWSKITGVPKTTIEARLNRGCSLAEALTPGKMKISAAIRELDAKRTTRRYSTPRGKLYTHNGETLSLSRWADRLGVSINVLHKRLSKGWTIEQTLSTPAIHSRDRHLGIERLKPAKRVSPMVEKGAHESKPHGATPIAHDLNERTDEALATMADAFA